MSKVIYAWDKKILSMFPFADDFKFITIISN